LVLLSIILMDAPKVNVCVPRGTDFKQLNILFGL
jgi:hypothetical protein